LALQPGDLSPDWLDVSDQIANFILFERDDVANRLARKLGLSQTPSKDVMLEFAKSTRALQGQGRTADQAAIIATTEKFAAEFKLSR
jgi:hypothetical protein